MKKIITSITFLAFINLCYSQNTDSIPKPNIDSMLVNIDKSTLTSSFLYDRTNDLSNLTVYNTPEKNTASTAYFEQALQELHRASNKQKFKSVEQARKDYKSHTNHNNVNIGVIHTRLQYLNYNDEDESYGALKIENNLFSKINENPTFLEHGVLIIAPLLQYAVGETINYRFNTDLWFEDSDVLIQTIEANFDTATDYTIFTQGNYIQPELSILYTEAGYKNLTFIITYSDGSTKTTFGRLHVKFPITEEQRNIMDPLIEDITEFTSSIPFQGYDETTPIYGELDYRIFYHTNNRNSQRTLIKPIIIIDGFDPQDKRKIQDDDSPLPQNEHHSIEEIMTYENSQGVIQFLIPVLRNAGYDVIIVNHPTYIRGNKIIDGGADYIERNALSHVSLYNHLNAVLLENGSSEELVIVGPSMGGQISRYALAYMEKHNIDHNTRLWVSIDSPHLGANIPMGIQSMVNLLASFGESVAAQDFYNNQLKSIASNQQLIDQHIEYHLPDYLNNGSPVRQQYFSNLNSNGLPNSNGYPQNLRKIAIINGSITGKHNASAGQEDFRIHGFADGIFGNIKVAEMNTNYMPTTGGSGQVARLWRRFKITRTASYTNNSIYGSLDVLPGGLFNSEDQIHASIMGETPDIYSFGNGISWGNLIAQQLGFSLLGITGDYFESYTNKKVHAFIPTVSALGFFDSDFNWGEYIDTNLICDEIPFDSFYAPLQNEQHTSFTESSVNWLLEELANNPQPIHGSPNYNTNLLIGASTSQECQTRQYIAPFVHNVDTYVWTLSGDNTGYCNWEIISGQGSRILTIQTGIGYGIVTCRPQNSCGNGTIFYKNLHGEEVTNEDCEPSLSISPNPNNGENIVIVLKLPPNDPCNQIPNDNEIDFTRYEGDNLWVYDFYGTLLHSSLETNDRTEIIGLDLISGIYIIKRMDKYGRMITEKLIKE